MVAIVYTSSAKPKRGWGTYRNVYVVDVPYWLAWKHPGGDGTKRGPNYWRPYSVNDKNVLAVLRHFGRRHCGSTERCEYSRTLATAHDFCRTYNARRDQAEGDLLISTGSA